MKKLSDERRKELRAWIPDNRDMYTGQVQVSAEELLALLDEVEELRGLLAEVEGDPEVVLASRYEEALAEAERLREQVKALELQLKAAEAETSDFVGVYGEAMRKVKALEGERDRFAHASDKQALAWKDRALGAEAREALQPPQGEGPCCTDTAGRPVPCYPECDTPQGEGEQKTCTECIHVYHDWPQHECDDLSECGKDLPCLEHGPKKELE